MSADTNKKLVAEIEGLITNSDLQKKLKVDCIMWSNIFVKIQNTLLSTPPSCIEKTQMGGYRKLNELEYFHVLKRWKERGVGGREEISEKCDSRYWYPSDGSYLYGLYCEMGAESRETTDYRYYLLVSEGKNKFKFLKKISKGKGRENSLTVISLESVDPATTLTLESILSELKKIPTEKQ